jgi:hypothetical protein
MAGFFVCILKRKEVTQVHRTLGYNLNLVDSNAYAVKMLVIKAKQSNTTTIRSNLKPHQKRLAYRFPPPSITFPAPSASSTSSPYRNL